MGSAISTISTVVAQLCSTSGDGPSASHEQAGPGAALPRQRHPSGELAGLSAIRRPPPEPNEAAATIQAGWRGGRQRELNAAAAQQHTPYRNEAQYKMATNGYSDEAMKADGPGGWRENNGWKSYAAAREAPPGALALLHSFQRKEALQKAKQALFKGKPPPGAVYEPKGAHDMRVNSAWMLGLAHRGTPALMTARLDKQNIVRNEARKSLPAAQQTTEHHLSALAREVVGMTQNGHFSVGEPLNGMQVLVANPSAAKATLKDFATPGGMPETELKRRLDEVGIDTAGLNDKKSAPRRVRRYGRF